MTTPTINVSVDAFQVVGTALPNAKVRLTLTRDDTFMVNGGGIVPAGSGTIQCDANGHGAGPFFPNALGTKATQYLVEIFDQNGMRVFPSDGRPVPATLPNTDVALHTVLFTVPPLSRADADYFNAQALASSQSAAASAATVAGTALSVSLDRQAADQDVVLAQGAALTATGQASLAQGYAASAGSVAQQDLSGAIAAAMHRSPNAIVAMALYETRADSDGGAALAKVDASYLYETLSGKWLGAQASEAAARAVAGAATNDYFQLTGDGKFYKLNAGAGTTEVFRGNKARFPRTAAIVAEASRVVIYDLLEPGRPMWMVFVNSGATASTILNIVSAAQSLTSAAMREGRLVLAGTQGGCIIDFARDIMIVLAGNQQVPNKSRVADRNAIGGANNGGVNGNYYALPNTNVNAIAMCTMPDAPLDPVTGLQVPTIALATGGGLCLIKQDGSVVSSSNTGGFNAVMLSPYVMATCQNSVSWLFALLPGRLTASFALTGQSTGSAGGPDVGTASSNVVNSLALGQRGTVGFRNSAGALCWSRFNESTPTGSLIAKATGTHNTGWMVGDIRRCLLSDVLVGTVGTELITATADRDFSADTGFWTKPAGVTISAGSCAYAAIVPGGGLQRAGFVTAGQRYKVTFTILSITGGGILPYVGGTSGTPRSAVGTYTEVLTAGTDGILLFRASGSSTTCTIDDVSCIEAEAADRSYKGKNASVNGTLTRSAVGVASQLMAWGGWSAANYLREAYSADLDFGTGGGYVSAWVNYTNPGTIAMIASRESGVGAPGYQLYVDATGKLNALFGDATTSRIATAAGSHAGAGWVFVEGMLLLSGTVILKVNGEVAGTTAGNPLGTLNNAAAPLTIGANSAATQPFSTGSIALVRISATAPSDDASRFMYQQERAMFRDGAQVTLPDTGALVDLDYDPMEDKWKPVTAANEATFVGLVRTASAPASAGSISKVAHKGAIKLLARTTTNPGVDVTLPSLNLQEQLQRRAEEVARNQRGLEMLDWVGGFTAAASPGSTTTTSPTGVSIPVGAALKGAQIQSAGSFSAGTTIVEHDAAFSYFRYSTPSTVAGNGNININYLDYILPTGMEAKEVFAGVQGSATLKKEGATADYQRLFDGFRERVRFAVAPGYTAHVRVNARRMAA